VEGYTMPSNYSSARPDLRPGFATVGCLVKGCRFPIGKPACAVVGVTLLLPLSAAYHLTRLQGNGRNSSSILAFLDDRAFGKAISSFSCISPTTKQEDILLFRKHVLDLIALVAPEGQLVMIGTLTVRISTNAMGQLVCQPTAASVQVTDTAGKCTTALLCMS
jgi:hypothetical protein